MGNLSLYLVCFVVPMVIGFAVQSFNNGTLTTSTGSLVQSQYGGNFVHKGTRRIQ